MGDPSDLMEWTPEDDVLLKNAIEAGASLGSLAKGAVQFSHRFDIQQLEKRWRTLLYGLGSPEEVSARIGRIAENEIELATSNPTKANRSCNSKGKESLPGRQKKDNVRSHYNAMRKRIRTEPYSSSLVFLLPHEGIGADNGSTDLFRRRNDHLIDNLSLGEPLQNDYGHPEIEYRSWQHAFPEMVRTDSGANGNISCHGFHSENVVSVQDELPPGMNINCLYGYTENITSVSVDEVVCNYRGQSFEHNSVEKVFPDVLEKTCLETSPDTGEIAPPNALGIGNPYENENRGPEAFTGFDSTNANRESLHCEFVGNDYISSQIAQCGDSFQDLGFTSSGMPNWSTMEGISTPSVAMDRHYEDKDQGTLAVNHKKNTDALGCDDLNKSKDGKHNTGLNNQTIISENDLMGFSTYIDFPEDDLNLFDVDEKDVVDGSCLDGLSFLTSPGDLHQDVVANSSDLRETNVLETGLATSEAACLGVICCRMHSGLDDNHGASASNLNISCPWSRISQTAEPLQEFMICVLNTEDSEIPCNDHVIFPAQDILPSSTNLGKSYRENTGFISSSKVLSSDARAIAGDFSKVNYNQTAISPSSVLSVKASSHILPKVGDGRIVELQSTESNAIVRVSRYSSITHDNPNSCTPVTVASDSASEKSIVRGSQKHHIPDTFEAFLENELQGTVPGKVCLLRADSCNETPNRQLTHQTMLPAQVDLVSSEVGISDSVAIMPTSEQEQLFYDSDDHVPNFSDIESLILGMDLGPYDKESSLFNNEESRYQPMDTKKEIVRLEHFAQSYMNRVISSHGAFAVFYGKHLKYFIKDTEVSLGRKTEDVRVDIDLGREGHANKISRRQAIIKMDEEGTFFLKNTGKFPISVNGEEVPPQKQIHLDSGCLVKIKYMTFTFEVNDRAVTKYIRNQQQGRSQVNNTSFDWKPDQNF